MNKLGLAILTIVVAVVLSACGDNEATTELEKNDTEKAEAKVGKEEPVASKETEVENEEQTEDIWTYYNDATWSEDFNGLKTTIQKVVITDIAPTVEDESAEVSAVGVKFSIENTSDHVFTTYPDQAILVTSTGEQIDMPDMWISDSLGGEIHEGVIKEGNVIWYLERGEAAEIEWIKLEWTSEDTGIEDFELAYKTHTVELELK